MYENQMMYNNYGYTYPNGAMQQYNSKFHNALMTQPLTNEEKAILRSKGGQFSTKITQDELLKSYCTHRDNGVIVASQNQDGSFTCPICQETFNAVSLDKADLEADVNKVIDDLQNVKLTYLDIPVEVARQYFTLIPLLKKLPQLGVIAANNWAQYENANPTMTAGNPAYGFAQYNQMLLGGIPSYGGVMYQQPIYAQQPMYQQPMYQQPATTDPNTMVNPMNPNGGYPMYQNGMVPPQAGVMYQQPGAMVGNEFGTYGAPGYVPQPQVNQPAPTAQTQQPVVQNPVPTPAAPVPTQQGKQVEVNQASFSV